MVPLVRRQPMIGSRRLRASRVRADCITDRTSASDFSAGGMRTEPGDNVDRWQHQGGGDLGRYRDVHRQDDAEPE